MKKSLLFIPLLLASTAAFSMQFYPGKYSAKDRNVKWSNCVWGNNVNFDTDPLPGKPGPNDDVTVRPGVWNFEIDGNHTVAHFHTGDGSKSLAKGKNFKARRKISLSLSAFTGGETRQIWEKSQVEVGGPVEITFWHLATSAGKALFSVVDSKFVSKGDLICTVPANPIIKNTVRAGVEIRAEGASELSFGGGAVIDSIFVDQNDQWFFKFSFKENNGKLPRIFFQRNAQFEKCDLEVEVSDKVKSGKYCLAEFQDKKSGFKDCRSVVLNGNAYNLGDTVKLGKRNAKLYMGSFGRDSKTPNDLILEIK